VKVKVFYIKRIKGYTLIEILIIILLIGIFSTGFLSFYKAFLKSEREFRFRIKTEQDIPAFVNYLRKELSSIGFGMDSNYSKVNNIIYCASDRSCLEFYSLNLRQTMWSGCWWICSKNSTSGAFQFMTTATTRFGSPCPQDLARVSNNTDDYLVLNATFERNQVPLNLLYPQCTFEYMKTIWFYKGNNTYPGDFKGIVKLDSTQDKVCAPGTYDLSLQVGNDPSQPLLSCVKKIYFDLNSTTYRTLLKVCLLLQVGGRRESPSEDFPDFPSLCGCSDCTLIYTDEDKYYRYRFIKEIIPLFNIVKTP
jgi:type II secretory pathway component PulJ